jgi:hypothetical protein
MKWVQWISGLKKPGKIHATTIGHKTFCDRVIPTNLVYNKPLPPKNCKDICKFCKKIEAQTRSFDNLLR